MKEEDFDAPNLEEINKNVDLPLFLGINFILFPLHF